MSTTPVGHPRHRLWRAAAILQWIYALIEVADCLTVILMALQILPNLYPAMLFPEVQELFDHRPIYLLPLFLFFTSLRAVSALGLTWRREWGFWLALSVTVFTVIVAPVLLPFTALELLIDGGFLILLLVAYFGDRPIDGG